MSSDKANFDWAWKATAVTFCIAGIIYLICKTIEAITSFYHAHTNWFGFIIAIVVIGIIYFFLRDYINSFIKRLFTPKPDSPSDVIKPDIADTKRNKHDK